MTFSGPLEDRVLIRERMGAYSDAVFRCDVEAYLDCWHDDGVRMQGDAEVRGKHALRTHWESAWEHLDKMTFFTELGATEVMGEWATARSYCYEILFLTKGGMRKVVGQYDDVLVREAGRWIFMQRSYELLMDEEA